MTQAPPARPARPAPTWRDGQRQLRTALGLFTILPVRADPEIARDEAVRAVLWLPAAGLLVSVPAAGVLLAVEAGGHDALRRMLGATLALGVLALLTGVLHLDGLADTADGLGSRRPAGEALAIMRRPDIGPFGVAALLFTVVAQITALATVAPGWPEAAASIGCAHRVMRNDWLRTGFAGEAGRCRSFESRRSVYASVESGPSIASVATVHPRSFDRYPTECLRWTVLR